MLEALGPDTLPVIGILVLAAAFRSTFGFGDALVSMPLLTLVLNDLQLAAPLFALTSPLVGVAMLLQDRRSVAWGSAARLLLGAVLGIPLGIAILMLAPTSALSIGLGIVLIAAGILGAWRSRVTPTAWLHSPHWAVPFGIMSGFLGGAINAGGPPLVVFAAGRAWSPAVIRSTLTGYFIPMALLVTLGHGAAGLWSVPILQTVALSLPFMLLAVVVGHRIHRRIPADRFHLALNLLLIVLGVTLLSSL